VSEEDAENRERLKFDRNRKRNMEVEDEKIK
jgi:hypothetical protein